MLNNVDLPAPFSPTMPTMLWRSTDRMTEASAATPAKLLLTSRTRRIALSVMAVAIDRNGESGRAAASAAAFPVPASGLLHRRRAEEGNLVVRSVLLLDL